MKKIKMIFMHIKEDCLDIKQFIEGVDYNEFIENKLIKKAVCMSLLNIGELVKTLPNDFREAHPQLPWKRIAGMRDIVAHKYKQLDMDAVWIVANERIPEILEFIEQFMNR